MTAYFSGCMVKINPKVESMTEDGSQKTEVGSRKNLSEFEEPDSVFWICSNNELII